MRLIIFLFTFISLFGGLSANSQTVNFTPLFSAGLDTAQGYILLKQCSRAIPKNISNFWTISSDDIKALESNFQAIYSLTSKECCWIGRKVDSLKNFGFQYVGVIINGQKYIYVNAFPFTEIDMMKKYSPNFDLTKSPIMVCDGGASFWGVLFETKTKKFSLLSFNGEA